MSRLTLEKILLLNLEQKLPKKMKREYTDKETAYSQLKQLTGQDFGYDAAQWRKWLKANPIDPDLFRRLFH